MADLNGAAIAAHGPAAELTEHDLPQRVATAGAMVGVGAIGRSLVDSMDPSRDVLALSAVDVDLALVTEGQGITIVWQGKPIFARHRISGRVRQGPAPANLAAAPYQFTSDTRIKAG